MWILDKLRRKKEESHKSEAKPTDPSDFELSFSKLKAHPKQVIVKDGVKTVPVKPPQPPKRIEFNVAGVTKENEKGKDIQAILKRVANAYKREDYLESFQGYTASELKEWYEDTHISEYESQYIDDVLKFVPEPDNEYDNNAIKVYLKDANGVDQHIGYVKRDVNKELLNAINTDSIVYITVEFVGGKTKYVNYDFDSDKYVIQTDEITRGLSVSVGVRDRVD